MPKACRVPTSGSDAGKYSLAKTRPVTVLYRKKSYHSIVVPTVLAITARRNCARCSKTDSPSVALSAVVIAALLPQGSALCRRPVPHLSAKNDHWQPRLRPSFAPCRPRFRIVRREELPAIPFAIMEDLAWPRTRARPGGGSTVPRRARRGRPG